MKKAIIAALSVGAMVLAGCAKTEVTDIPDSRYIGFDNTFIGNPTKAVTETTIDNLESFTVYGGYQASGNLFGGSGALVSENSNGEWTYSPLVPWEDNQTYNFYAYSKLPNGTVVYNYDNFQITDVTVDAANQTDFVYAATKNVPSDVEGTVRDKVNFSFDHMLSMVQFTIKSGFAADVTISISGLKLYGMNSTADLADGVWSSAETKIEETAAITFKEGTAVASEPDATNYTDNCVVMPQKFADDVVIAEFTVNATATASFTAPITKTITAKIPADTWESGFRYNYIVTIDGQTLNFITFDDPEVSQWKNYEDIEMDNQDDLTIADGQ